MVATCSPEGKSWELLLETAVVSTRETSKQWIQPEWTPADWILSSASCKEWKRWYGWLELLAGKWGPFWTTLRRGSCDLKKSWCNKDCQVQCRESIRIHRWVYESMMSLWLLAVQAPPQPVEMMAAPQVAGPGWGNLCNIGIWCCEHLWEATAVVFSLVFGVASRDADSHMIPTCKMFPERGADEGMLFCLRMS